MIQFHISDRCGTQPARNGYILNWRKGRPCSARDLIRERVQHEFETLSRVSFAHPIERHLVQYPRRSGCSLRDAVSLALMAFEGEVFFLLVDGRQITDMDEPFVLSQSSEVTFLRLLPKLAA
mgnify:CR=1 FL=1